MMKKLLSLAAIATIGAILSCQNEDDLSPQASVSADVLEKIADLGFSTDNVQLVDGDYLVEGDILLSTYDLEGANNPTTLRIAEVEQYHTFNLVNPQAITVSVSGTVSAAFSNAVNNAIARYNAETLNVTFQRVTSNGDINIRMVTSASYIASAGFPDRRGNPYREVKYNKAYSDYSDGFMTTVIAHEIGHCIGFRHTDYMNRSFSCGGSGGNEGSGSVGAVHIPGTPTGPDSGSWMLACLSATTNRPFNNNDKTALDYLY